MLLFFFFFRELAPCHLAALFRKRISFRSPYSYSLQYRSGFQTSPSSPRTPAITPLDSSSCSANVCESFIHSPPGSDPEPTHGEPHGEPSLNAAWPNQRDAHCSERQITSFSRNPSVIIGSHCLPRRLCRKFSHGSQH